MTDRVTRSVLTLELSEVIVVLVVVEVSSTFLSGVRPRLGDRRLGVTTAFSACCVTFCDFCDDGRPRPLELAVLAGDRDRERDLRPGERDLLRAGLRDGEADLERNLSSFCTKST